MEKSFGNNYDLNATGRFIKKWWKLLTIVFVVAFGISLAVSLLITPRYKSSAILFPTDSNRGSKAILADRYSQDYMDYGIERDCEYAIQVLSSQSMAEDVCDHFNLMVHYGIDPDDPHKFFEMYKQYRGYVTIKRTDYLGVEIGVLDVDPEYAANIANYIAANYDSICTRMQYQRADEAYQIMVGVSEDMQQDIFALEDSVRHNPQHASSLNMLIAEKTKELASVQSRASQTKIDRNYEYSYKFLLDKAQPSDKKAYPKRAVISLLGAFGSLAVCVLALLLVDMATRKEEKEQ